MQEKKTIVIPCGHCVCSFSHTSEEGEERWWRGRRVVPLEVKGWVAAGVVDFKTQNDFEDETSKDSIPEEQQQYICKSSLASGAAGDIGG